MTKIDLVPIEQKEVLFYGDTITAVLVEENSEREVYVSIRQMCNLLGVSYQGQIRRINDDPVLSEKVKGVNITFTPSGSRGGGPQETNCLPLDYLNGWLFGINANRVKEEVRDRLILYQERSYKVLAEAFREGRLTSDPDIDELLQNGDPDVVNAYQMALAVVKLARQQLIFDARIQSAEEQITVNTQRLDEIEAILTDDGRIITEAQAAELSQAVKTVALAMETPNFGAIYGQLYRHYEVTSYKKLRADQFKDAMNWLTAYYRRLTGNDSAPF